MFLWRVLPNAIFTHWNLYRSKIIDSPVCPICGVEEETIEHLLFLCPWTNAVRFVVPLNYIVDMRGFSSVDRWLKGVINFQGLSKREVHFLLTNISFICWEIWKTGCNFVFKSSHIDPRLTIDRAIQNRREFLDAKAKSPMPFGDASVDPNILAQGWRPLMSNYVKINFDGAWKKDSHLAGLGVVARDAIGSFCGGLATSFHCNLALVAEAAASLRAFKFALNHNFTDIILETDSKILVEGVRGGENKMVFGLSNLFWMSLRRSLFVLDRFFGAGCQGN
ncbi:hypothetical protein PRUPE_8G032200 [Prunus persica]|uniref:RNase H type-1 domain-containing protein n=1 Tax=Prunus persica TaxID=3760 RepID=A0A251MS55_PRUPE|nr:hypothetical protein PRUPE_8G032200 [Prunus persica]